MLYGWIELPMVGWFQNGNCHFEYLPEHPFRPLWCERRPKGVVYQNLKMAWVAYMPIWLDEHSFKSRIIGTFKEDRLPEAMLAIEADLSQLSIF